MSRAITDRAVLIGFSPEGKCVYSESIPLGDYWDGDHAWDSGEQVKRLRLEKLRGYLFDSNGDLLQEFESKFDLARGIFASGWARHADGTFQEHRA
jgi:hypothetical protein